MKVLNESEFKELVEETDKTVLVDFYATWCGPCRMLAPILEEVANEVNIEIYKVDVDECENVAKRYGILSIPTMIMFKNGKEVEKVIGLRSKEEIVQLIEKFSNI